MKKVIVVLAIIVIGLCAYDVTMIILNNSERNNAGTVRLESTATSVPTAEPTIDAVLDGGAAADETVTDENVVEGAEADGTVTDDTVADNAADTSADDAAAEM